VSGPGLAGRNGNGLDHDRHSCLVADDHPALVAAVSAFLAQDGIDVVASARDGLEAVARAVELSPDVALVDYRMPALFGPNLVRRLREAAAATRVVVYTADADEEVMASALEAGASGIVLKEAPLADLGRALRTVVRGGTYVDPALAFGALGAAKSTAPRLTEREAAVLHLLAEGASYDDIAARLGISVETTRTHVRKACSRLDATTRTQAVAVALRHGLIA
jgi:DNA-binding NarL/FixJ family response regulator